ncbi:amidohydrolase family protein [Candidatus Bathyarchaeota archaeon]|nr:amidohydrolase family protein [Candidatus Bathyarchaeota archaeon]
MSGGILDYETYWSPDPKGLGNLDRLVDLFNEVSRDYRVVLFPPSGSIHPMNREMHDALSAFSEKDRFIPCAYINPNLYDAVEELDTAVNEYGFRGMKLMPTIHRYNVDCVVTHPIMRKARDLAIPVTIHSSSEGCYPQLIGRLAESFPDVPIIMDHSGYRYFQAEALEVGRRHKNLYFGLSLVTEPAYIDQVSSKIGVDKLIYGSNAPAGIPKIGLMVYEYTELATEEKELALGKNLAGLLRL